MRLTTKWIALLVLLLALTPERGAATPNPTAAAPESTTVTTPDSIPQMHWGVSRTIRKVSPKGTGETLWRSRRH